MAKFKKKKKNNFYFLNSYDEWIQLNPNNYYYGWIEKGELLEKLTKYDEALKWLKKIILIFF